LKIDTSEQLIRCIDQMHNGSWQFIQLRGTTFDKTCINSDDIDLLGTSNSVDALLEEAFKWVREGLCHVHVSSRRIDKTEFSLYSIDGRYCAKFDLWVNLWQINDRKSCLRYPACSKFVSEESSSIKRLPVDLEACVYVQHLQAKNKKISGRSAQMRLTDYISACEKLNHDEIVAVLSRILKAGTLSIDDCHTTLDYLLTRVELYSPSRFDRSLDLFRRKVREVALAAPRKTKLISVMGCDGAGKTTLAHAIKDQFDTVTGVFTGKHLYRKSYIHKAAVIFIRPLLFQSRENFDERLAPLVYLRACLGIYIRYWRQGNKGVLLIDRSIVDFLYLNRKTDHPSFCRLQILTKLFGKRIPTVHCLVSYANLAQRKLEMSQAGHSKYDSDMFHHFVRQSPTNYLLFNNDSSLEQAVDALTKIILPAR